MWDPLALLHGVMGDFEAVIFSFLEKLVVMPNIQNLAQICEAMKLQNSVDLGYLREPWNTLHQHRTRKKTALTTP